MKTRIAIVTGASAGIGRATAIRLAQDFSGLVLVARREEELEETAAAVEAAGAEPLIIAADLRQAEAADKVIKETIDKFGRIDALVNIAGAVPQIHLFEMTDEQWNDGAEMKLHGARRLNIKAWPYLKELPEYAGKLNFYLNAIDGTLKHEMDQPTIGILICKEKNKVVAEYALRLCYYITGLKNHCLTWCACFDQWIFRTNSSSCFALGMAATAASLLK